MNHAVNVIYYLEISQDLATASTIRRMTQTSRTDVEIIK